MTRRQYCTAEPLLHHSSAIPGFRHTAVRQALVAAILFGAATPLAKYLLVTIDPWQLAGLLYLGSGIGLGTYRLARRLPAVRAERADLAWLAAAIVSGGIIAPVLLLFGLAHMPASGAALLLNAEGVFTALLAWIVFKEHVDRRIALGMVAIAAGAAVLSWPAELTFAGLWPGLAVLAACLAWALDNNLTRKVSLTDATWIAATKGLVAGVVNVAIATFLGASAPPLLQAGLAMLAGFLTYGVSLVFFVLALRGLGASRTAAYFSLAPFVGALIALLSGEPLTARLLLCAALMGFGLWLHLGEMHEHDHQHESLEHEHEHLHDAHHPHDHDLETPPEASHTHPHKHTPHAHSHPHYPDPHHRHKHRS